jgi:DNA topoisomerase-1
MGLIVTDYLQDNFENIMDYNFTARIEKEFDDIAEGNMVWTKMIDIFYKPFFKQIGVSLKDTTVKKFERELGLHPEKNKPIFVKVGRYGPYVQLGDSNNGDELVYASLRKEQNIETITLEEALELFKLPRNLGVFEDEDVIVAIGKFGPYIKHNKKFYSLKKPADNPYTVEFDRAIQIIEENRAAGMLFPREFNEIPGLKVLKGRFGPYISYEEKNYKIAKKYDPASITADECKEIMEEQKSKKSK